jgi:hypothetical protein
VASPGSNPAGAFENESERAELAGVLASGLFKRSPKLSRLLSYVCEKSFREEADQVTEYSIAVDVLERDVTFDPQIESVVRVDMHHLRKRLKSYYEGEGKDHAVEIVIPGDRYVPDFIVRQLSRQVNGLPVTALPSHLATPAPPRRWIAAGMLLIALGLFTVARMLGHVHPPDVKYGIGHTGQ